MADFVPHYTPRLKITYSSLGRSHDMTFRMPRGTTAASLQPYYDKIEAFLNEMASFRYTDWTLLGVQFALTDSVSFFPIGHNITPTNGTLTLPAAVAGIHRAQQAGFSGRTAASGRTALYLFGIAFTQTVSVIGDFRVTGVEVTAVGNAVAQLNADPALVGNDNATATWNNYTLIKANDFIRRQEM